MLAPFAVAAAVSTGSSRSHSTIDVITPFDSGQPNAPNSRCTSSSVTRRGAYTAIAAPASGFMVLPSTTRPRRCIVSGPGSYGAGARGAAATAASTSGFVPARGAVAAAELAANAGVGAPTSGDALGPAPLRAIANVRPASTSSAAARVFLLMTNAPVK